MPSSPRLVIFSVAGAPYRDVYYVRLAEQMQAEIFYAKVLSSAPDHAWSGSQRAWPQNLIEKTLPAISLKGSGWLRRWREGRNPLVLPTPGTWKAIEEWNPDILIIQEYSPVALTLLLWAKLRGRKVLVMTDVGRETGGGLGKITRIRHAFFGRFVDGQLAHTVAACMPLAEGITNICFSPHAVEVPDQIPPKGEISAKVRFLYVGNLIERKGVDLLLNAFRRVQEQGFKSRFLLRLVGGGDSAWLKSELESLGNDVELVGFKENEALEAEYRAADAFVLPSRFDTFGVVAHEAAAAGLALILSPHAGSSELFGNQEQVAQVVAPEDTDGLASAIKDLIDDPILCRQRGEAAWRIARRWSVEENAKRTAHWLIANLGESKDDRRKP
jgi:glycosyltransferase involved in cell wall biosynthesis